MATLTLEHKQHFEEFGFVKIQELLDPKGVIDPVISEYKIVLDNLADQLFDNGKIQSKYEDLEFGERVTKIYSESGEVHNQFFDFSLPQSNIKNDTPFWTGPAVFNAIRNPELLDIVEGFIGSEIYSNPIQHVRIKVPEKDCPRDKNGNVIFGATPWHQDAGVATEEIDNTDMLTVWFPLTDATEDNGCLQIVPGSHKGKVLTHCPGFDLKTKKKISKLGPGGLQIPEKLFKSEHAMPIPMKKGDVLLFTKKTVHSALPNLSDQIRWSFDLRYQPVGQPTGRDMFPGFIARSKEDPDAVLEDSSTWNQMWIKARDSLAKTEQFEFNRWDGNDIACA